MDVLSFIYLNMFVGDVRNIGFFSFERLKSIFAKSNISLGLVTLRIPELLISSFAGFIQEIGHV